MKWKVNASFIPNLINKLTFIPTQRQVNMDFKTHVNADGGNATNNQTGGGFWRNCCSNRNWKWKQIIHPPPNPDTYPSHQKIKEDLWGHRMGGIKNHPPHLLEYPTTLLLILPEIAADVILLVPLPLLQILFSQCQYRILEENPVNPREPGYTHHKNIGYEGGE